MVHKEILEKEEKLYEGVLSSLIKFVQPITQIFLWFLGLVVILIAAKILHAVLYLLLVPFAYQAFTWFKKQIKGGKTKDGIRKRKETQERGV